MTTRRLTNLLLATAAFAAVFVLVPAGRAKSHAVTNGRIAFQSARPPGDQSSPDIYTIDPDGSNTAGPLTTAYTDGQPAFSPDGTRIAFSTFEFAGSPCCNSIAVMNADGSSHAKVVNGDDTHSGVNGSPAWSPDGQHLAFVSTFGGSASQIGIVGVGGGGLTQITTGTADSLNPAWSPDGTRIAFDSNPSGNSDIYTMNTDGTDVQQLTSDPGDQIQPAWSPDGTKIAYVSTSDHGYEIFVMNANGSNPVQLTNNSNLDEQPAWSPDGTKIAFLTDRDHDYEIYTMNADGSSQTRVTNSPNLDEHPSWGPATGGGGPDTAPPTVTITLDSPNGGTPDGQNGWFVTGPVTGTVSADDRAAGGSNIAALDCGSLTLQTSGIGTPTATGRFSIPDDGAMSISCTGSDSASNTSAPVTKDIQLDSHAPDVSLNPAADSCSGGKIGDSCLSVQTAGFTALDVTSGTASPCAAAASSACDFTQSSSVQGASVTIGSGAVCDLAGNCNAGIDAGPFEIGWPKWTILPRQVAVGEQVSVQSVYRCSPPEDAVDWVAAIRIAGTETIDLPVSDDGIWSGTVTVPSDVGLGPAIVDATCLDRGGGSGAKSLYLADGILVTRGTWTIAPAQVVVGDQVSVQAVNPCPRPPDAADWVAEIHFAGSTATDDVPVPSDGSWSATVTIPSIYSNSQVSVSATCLDRGGAVTASVAYVDDQINVKMSALTVVPEQAVVGDQVSVQSVNPCPRPAEATEWVALIDFSGLTTESVVVPVSADGSWSATVTIASGVGVGQVPVTSTCLDRTGGSSAGVRYLRDLISISKGTWTIDPGHALLGGQVTVRSVNSCPRPSDASDWVAEIAFAGASTTLVVPVSADGSWSATLTIPNGVVPGDTSVAATCLDRNGFEFLGTVEYVDDHITVSAPPDSIPPAVGISLSSPNSGTPDGANGWFVSGPVIGTVSADDTGTGDSNIASINCGSLGLVKSGIGTPSASGSFSITADGITHISCTATDAAGNASGPVTKDVKLDTHGPTLAPTVGPVPVLLHGRASATPNAADATSGVASQSCAAVDMSTVGVHTLACTARDNAGNVSSATASYLVEYKILGFLSPPSNSRLKRGSTVLIRIALADAHSVRIPDAEAAALLSPVCRVRFGASGAQSANACVTYNARGKEFHYSWKLGQQTGNVTISVAVGYAGAASTTVLSEPIVITR